MKILQICSVRVVGGGERHLIDLVTWLVKQGHEVSIAVVSTSAIRQSLRDLPEQHFLRLSRWNHLKNALQLIRFVRTQHVEIIHAHAARDYPLAAIVARWACGARLILTRHVLFPLGKANKILLRPVAAFIAVSQAVADGLRRNRAVDPANVVLVYNGIDVNRYSSLADRRDYRDGSAPLLIGTIGHLAAIKGQEDFVRAAAQIVHLRDDVNFLIIGDDKSRRGENRKSIERLIESLRMGERVKLGGWVDDVLPTLSALSLFVSSARVEPFGLSIVEAMASGLPVIATMSDGAREIIQEGVSGKLVPVGHVDALAKAIIGLLDDQNERERLGRNALRTARERFSLERMARETETVYRKAIRAK